MKSGASVIIVPFCTTILLMVLYISTTSGQIDIFQCPIFVLIGRNHNEYCCSDSQCKSTICHEHECKCKSVGGACEKNVECCSGNCNTTSFKCECSFKLGGLCSVDQDCCAGVCTSDFTCGPKADGGSCTLNTDCDSQFCNSNKTCGCLRLLDECSNDEDCCPSRGGACRNNKCCVLPTFPAETGGKPEQPETSASSENPGLVKGVACE